MSNLPVTGIHPTDFTIFSKDRISKLRSSYLQLRIQLLELLKVDDRQREFISKKLELVRLGELKIDIVEFRLYIGLTGGYHISDLSDLGV
jgi:hypothetical protein